MEAEIEDIEMTDATEIETEDIEAIEGVLTQEGALTLEVVLDQEKEGCSGEKSTDQDQWICPSPLW